MRNCSAREEAEAAEEDAEEDPPKEAAEAVRQELAVLPSASSPAEEEVANRRVEASRRAKASHLAAVAGRAKASHQAARGEAAAGVGGPTLDVVHACYARFFGWLVTTGRKRKIPTRKATKIS